MLVCESLHDRTAGDRTLAKTGANIVQVRTSSQWANGKHFTLELPDSVEIDPLMYMKLNKKSGSAKSLAWFLLYFYFRFWLRRFPVPDTIFRRFQRFVAALRA